MIETRYLKDNIKNIQKLFAIPALRRFEMKVLGQLLSLSKIRQYEDGEVILKEGDLDQWMYFLLSGKLRVVKKGITLATIDKIGELFGEMRMIDSLSRSASVYAVGKTACLAVDTAIKNKLSSEDETIDSLLLLYRVLAEYISIRLRLTNEELIAAKKEIAKLTRKKG